mmetsp:Transcript_10653/g.31713  ORF Transcript_10653/g.31713 Transcript_10653/m.31713 type:complete len:255 (-) Transcript_10653:713-1477(-)
MSNTEDIVSDNHGGYAALNKSAFDTKEEAERASHQKRFRYYVTYLMDGRERVREMLRNGKYPMPKAAGRPPKRRRLDPVPENDDLAGEPDEGQQPDAPWRKEALDTLQTALITDKMTSVLKGQEDDYTPGSIHCSRIRVLILREFIRLLDISDDSMTVHAIAGQTGAYMSAWQVTGRIVRDWFYQFKEAGYLIEDMRGKWKRELLVMEDDIKISAIRWMKDEVRKETLSVDRFHGYINELLVKKLSDVQKPTYF